MRVTTMTPEPTNNPTNDPDDVIYISAQGINEKYRQFIVKSTDREIKNMLRSCDDDGASSTRKLYISTAREINRYSVDELNEHAEANTQEYINWNTDVVIFYIAKFTLFGVPIPIVKI